MAEILLFHHAQGLTPGIVAFADSLRASGHTVHTPDLYAGRTFATLEEGIAHAKSVGFGTLLDAGVVTAEALPPDLVYAGFSLGVMLAQTRAGARGAVLIDACLPVEEFGDRWPDGVPVQVHGMDADPLFAEEGDLDAARELVSSAQQAELFLYPGNVHLFADASLPSYDEAATETLISRILALVASIEPERAESGS